MDWSPILISMKTASLSIFITFFIGLFAAVPTVGEKPLVQGIDAKGEIPSPVNLPKGCYFSDRCPYATDRCRQEKPVLREVEPGHMAACHLL